MNSLEIIRQRSLNRIFINAYSVLTETTEAFKYVRWMLNKGKSCERVAENIEVSLKKAVKIAELPSAEKLID